MGKIFVKVNVHISIKPPLSFLFFISFSSFSFSFPLLLFLPFQILLPSPSFPLLFPLFSFRSLSFSSRFFSSSWFLVSKGATPLLLACSPISCDEHFKIFFSYWWGCEMPTLTQTIYDNALFFFKCRWASIRLSSPQSSSWQISGGDDNLYCMRLCTEKEKSIIVSFK